MRGVDELTLGVPSAPAATTSRNDDRLSEAFGINLYQWGVPANIIAAPPTNPLARRSLGALITIRIADDESNSEFEARVDEEAVGYVTGKSAEWVDGELKFKNHRYTEAVLHLNHAPTLSPVKGKPKDRSGVVRARAK